jgi:hypothetical protein
MTVAYDTMTAAVTAMMAGNEFAVSAFIHPQLRRLDGRAHAQAAAPIAAVLGKAMPVWYSLAFALLVGAVFEHRPISHGPGLCLALAASLWAATIVFTVTMLAPINNRIARMNFELPYNALLSDCTRWDLLHRIRVVMLMVSVFLLLAGLLQSSR